MNIKITSDSTCDLSEEILKRYDIALLPLSVIMDGKTHRDQQDISPTDIFRHVEAGGKLCSTSAINVEDYRRYFAAFSAAYDAVIHITIGSGFSSCYQNASIAASSFTNVFVVDSMNLSTGQGLLVVEAAQLSRKGISVVEICSHLHEIRGRVETSFLLDRLDYMQKGGRCSATAALGANLLRIKPCIAVQGGCMGVSEKYRGSFQRCVEKYVRDRLKDRRDLRRDRIFITHSGCAPEIVEAVQSAIRKYADFDEILETQAGCTVSCHCGPGTLGILFLTR